MSSNNRIVSIVDDDPGITMFFHEALRTIPGITIFTFTDPVLALEHFEMYGYAYVLVISDYKMPSLNGMEFLKKIKEQNRFVRTILMTAFTIDDGIFQQHTKKQIINGFLQKPIGLHDLVKEVNTQLDSYELQKNIRLADNGPALGPHAGEKKIKGILEAGFIKFRHATETPFNIIYEARPYVNMANCNNLII